MAEELVQTYEPVLYFARGENFFPMGIDPYLRQYSLHVTSGTAEVMRVPSPYVDSPLLAHFFSREHFLVYADERIAEPEEAQLLRDR